MTEKSTAKQEDAQVIEAQSDEAIEPQESSAEPKRGAALPWLLTLILLAALVAAGWAGYRYVYQELLVTNQQLQQQLAEQDQQLQGLRQACRRRHGRV